MHAETSFWHNSLCARRVTEHQTLRLSKFERSRATKHYTCAGLSAREPPNTTPVQVRARTEHQTLNLFKFERSRTTKHYTCARSSAHGTPNLHLSTGLTNLGLRFPTLGRPPITKPSFSSSESASEAKYPSKPQGNSAHPTQLHACETRR